MDVDRLLNFEKRTGIKDDDIEDFIRKATEVEAAVQGLRDGTVNPDKIKIEGIDSEEEKQQKEKERQQRLEQQRIQTEQLRLIELEKAQRLLAKGEDPATVIEALSNALTNKFLHAPSHALNHSSGFEHEQLETLLRQLYQIKT